jgi:hypothetical protein
MTDPYPWLVKIASMARGKGQRDGASGLPTAAVNLSSARGDAAVMVPRFGLSRSPLGMLRTGEALRSPIYGQLALAILAAGTLAVVLVATAAPSVLSPDSQKIFPTWMAGPLHGLLSPLLQRANGRMEVPWHTLDYAFSGVLVVMLIAYGVALACAQRLSMRTIALTVAGLYAFLVLSPPLGLSDTFNYLGYARLGALHGLNPYTHVIANERFDPVYQAVTWRNYHSPYGQVFTLLTYPLGLMSLPAAYWTLKAAIVALMGVFVALIARCARQLGHDPRFAVLFVALNPVVLIWGVGGFHNDPVMLVPMMASISLLLARRYTWAGVALAVAIGVKPTIVLLLPFMMLGARPVRQSLQVLLGTVLGVVVLGAVSVAMFGFSMPNVADQSIIVTPLGPVNLVGVLFHLGGASAGMEQASKVVLVLIVGALLIAMLARRRPDWISGSGWATLALLACTAWLMPWYIVWALPLVALSTSINLRRAMIVFTVFALATFLPVTAIMLGKYHIKLMKSPADQIATWKLYSFQHAPD